MRRQGAIARRSRALAAALCAAFAAALGAADWAAGPDVSLFALYLGPVGLAAWAAGSAAGMSVALVSGAASAWAHLPAAAPLSGAIAWRGVSAALVFCAFAIALARLRASLEGGRELARVDSLTGLLNRRLFRELATRELARSRRYPSCFTLAYVDVDELRAVNDRFGQAAGDTLLRLVASTLRKGTRDTDVVARVGGDEFGVILPETGIEGARSALARISREIEAVLRPSGWTSTVTVGAVTFERPPATVDEMARIAEAAMAEAKRLDAGSVRYAVWKGASATAASTP